MKIRIILEQELQRRKSIKKHYSLREFAFELKMDPSTLSRIMKGRRNPTIRTIHKICKKLNFNPEEID